VIDKGECLDTLRRVRRGVAALVAAALSEKHTDLHALAEYTVDALGGLECLETEIQREPDAE
jgi:hypothetical protein